MIYKTTQFAIAQSYFRDSCITMQRAKSNPISYWIFSSLIGSFSGWERLHAGSDEPGCRKSDSWDPMNSYQMTTSATTTTCSVARQGSTLSDSKLLDDEINEETRGFMRPKKPPRPKSEVCLDQAHKRKSKRYSAFGVCASNFANYSKGGHLMMSCTGQSILKSSKNIRQFL